MPATQQLHNGTFQEQKEITNKTLPGPFLPYIPDPKYFFITEYSKYLNNILGCGYGSS